ncbi:NFE2L2 [Bugula neritina]|uniref:NFE2L2 n=1 Tax=Bugula neritina TaxID=10212 RepID=A0A7J7JVI3_BUGNE|nr:NFE2L2 [Bugula neritina]
MASASSSSYFGSENGDSSSFMLNTQNEAGKEKRSICRDELRCKELEIPFTVSMITNYPVEEFNSLLRQHRLNEEQLTLVKDIRRRGKNKVAAQNCRKKKMNELTGLEAEINDLKRKRGELIRDKDELKRSKLHLRKQLDQTYIEVFNSVRDNLGRPYDPRYYTLHISDDGDAHIIPNKVILSQWLAITTLLNYHHHTV